jgi:3-hydroxyisobutyrate dehydrogenase-like beta-hydroxyacid dehydrogenase
MKLGFIGLGHMGTGMAMSLVKAGHDVSVFNRSPGRGAALVSLGAHEVKSVAAACDAEAVITMLADDDAASEIAWGEGGVIAHLPKGAVHVSMSSISVALSRRSGSRPCASRTALHRRPGVWATGWQPRASCSLSLRAIR